MMDPIEETWLIAKLVIIKATLDNMIQTCKTQDQRMKSSTPASEQPMPATPPPVQPNAERNTQHNE